MLKGLEFAFSRPGCCGILDPLLPGVSTGLLGQFGLAVVEDRGHREVECLGEQTEELKPVGNHPRPLARERGLLQGRGRRKGPQGSREGAVFVGPDEIWPGQGAGNRTSFFSGSQFSIGKFLESDLRWSKHLRV